MKDSQPSDVPYLLIIYIYVALFPSFCGLLFIRTADSMSGKQHTAAALASGSGCSFTVTSVITPRVPSAPINNRVRSYPEEDLRARPPVPRISPEGFTT